MQITPQIINDIQSPIFGFGAGLMLASLNYHLKKGGGRFQPHFR